MSFFRRFVRGLLWAAVLSSLFPVARASIDPANFDNSVSPAVDFYHYANGGWIRSTPIPASASGWGPFNEADERNHEILGRILERAAKDRNAQGVEKLVGDFFASGMDEAAINEAGIRPIAGELSQLGSIRTVAALQAAIAHLHELGVDVGFGFGSEQDPKNSTMMIAGAGQGGLGLPDRDYYIRDDEKSRGIQQDYIAHVARMLVLGGDAPDVAAREAAAVMKLETLLAKASKTSVELRDPVGNYHKWPRAALVKLMPHFDWTAYFHGIELPAPPEVDIGQEEFFRAFDRALVETPLEDWRAYLRWHLLHETAPYLSRPLSQENFAFFARELSGVPEQRERWKRVLDTIDSGPGEALGQLYVKENFPAESKARMLALVGRLRASLRARLQTVEWMDAPTRARALEKIDALNVKIGYPNKWIDYRRLQIDRKSYVWNVLRSNEFDFQRTLEKIGKPVDRQEWGLTPPSVNAYYSPSLNEVVFPAGILQPPFFDPKADDAVNYGGIGAVIGHEMTHGFDDEGRQFDAVGNLVDWWTPESAKRFAERAAVIVKQYSEFVVVGDVHVNGELTEGENIADLGGLKIAYTAFQLARKGRAAEMLGGFTPEQRFFISYASVWRENQRPEAMRLQANTDPHPPSIVRVNGPLSNLPEFAAAFNIPEGAPMRRSASQRAVIW